MRLFSGRLRWRICLGMVVGVVTFFFLSYTSVRMCRPTIPGTLTRCRLAGSLGMEPYWDNVAPFIFKNGSAVIMWRGTLDERIGCEALGTTKHWAAGPFAPHADAPVFPPNTNFTVPAEPCLSNPVYGKPCQQANIEDPHLWQSPTTGHYHASVLLTWMMPCRTSCSFLIRCTATPCNSFG